MKKRLVVLIILLVLLAPNVIAHDEELYDRATNNTEKEVKKQAIEQAIKEHEQAESEIVPRGFEQTGQQVVQEGATQAGKKEIRLSTFVLSLVDYDESGSYELSYGLMMDCNYDCNIDELVLLNGWVRNVVPLDTKKSGVRFIRSYRILGHLEDSVDLREYPFDDQTISIQYEHKDIRVKDLNLIVGPYTGVAARADLAGWTIKDSGAEVYASAYMTGDAFSTYKHTVTLGRGKLGAFFIHFFPILLIMLILLVTYILKIDKVQLRLTISSSILIATMVFHLAIATKLPPLGYLTFADKFMILTYMVTFATFVINIGLLKGVEVRKTTTANKFNLSARNIAIVAIPLSYIILFFFLI